MRHIVQILTTVFLLSSNLSQGQIERTCDTLYDISLVQIPAKYNSGIVDLNKYIVNELVPIISNCGQKDSLLTTSLYIGIGINQSGEVVGASIKKGHLTRECKEELQKKLLSMKGWTPAYINGRPVCSNFIIPISCLKYK